MPQVETDVGSFDVRGFEEDIPFEELEEQMLVLARSTVSSTASSTSAATATTSARGPLSSWLSTRGACTTSAFTR
jgi:hypothetical protein